MAAPPEVQPGDGARPLRSRDGLAHVRSLDHINFLTMRSSLLVDFPRITFSSQAIASLEMNARRPFYE